MDENGKKVLTGVKNKDKADQESGDAMRVCAAIYQFNMQQSYQAQKQTYTPLSTQLPSGQSSGKA
jgi:hypothetical protein